MMFLALALALSLPDQLSQTQLYSNIVDKTVAPENRSYEPQYPLWSDGGSKKRWFFLPPNTTINTGKPDGTPTSAKKGNLDYWIFPVGTKFWKEFSFSYPIGSPYRRIETRFAEKVAADEWEFATYHWNSDESEAFRVPADGETHVFPTGPNSFHDLPKTDECVTCHNRGGDKVLGFDALQLSPNRDPIAPHAVALGSDDVTLSSLVDEKRLTYAPAAWKTAPPTVLATNPKGRAAMGYLHGNCGNCHNPTGTAMHSYLHFRYPVATASEAASPVFLTAINQISSLTIPGLNPTYRIHPGFPERSAVIYAIRRLGDKPMPPIGNHLVDEEGVKLLESWIQELQ